MSGQAEGRSEIAEGRTGKVGQEWEGRRQEWESREQE
jgi:hypothetical protein